jgi:Mg2+-importing ATPase
MFMALILGVISTLDDFAFFALFNHISPEVLRTNWFIGSTLTELALLFSIRTIGPFYKAVSPSRPLLILTVSAALIAVLLPFTPLSRTFSFVAPTFAHLAMIIALVLAYFIATELAKLALLRRHSQI